METTVIGSYPVKMAFGTDVYEQGIRRAVEDQASAGITYPGTGQVWSDFVHMFTDHIHGITKQLEVVGKIEAPGYGMITKYTKYAMDYAKGIGYDCKMQGVLTGPTSLAGSCRIETNAYKTRLELARDITSVLIQEVKELEKIGVGMIHVDEPLLSVDLGQIDQRLGFIDWLASEVSVPFYLHICGDVRAIMPAVLRMKNVEWFANEFAATPENWEAIPESSNKKFIIGVIDVRDHKVESVDEVIKRIQFAVDKLGKENMKLVPDCGMRNLPYESAKGKLLAMGEAARSF